MKKLTEAQIEDFVLKILRRLGYEYIHGGSISPSSTSEERSSYGEVLLSKTLERAIRRINPDLPPTVQQQALHQLKTITSPELITNNQTAHQYLTDGITIEHQKDGQTRGEKIWLIDWQHPENNEFLAVNQYTITENAQRRPDIILFVNGIPLVTIELKNAADAKADTYAAYNQLQTYKRDIPSLFTYNALLIISDGLTAKAGSLSANYNRFTHWQTPNDEGDLPEIETLIDGMLRPTTLLDLIRHFTVFEETKTQNPETGLVSIAKIKKIAAYHQYYAVNKALANITQATQSDRRGGVIWHTQGSGKSLSMVFLAGKLVVSDPLKNPTVVILTDRNDLDDQLFDTFASCRQLLRQEPQQANDRATLQTLLKVASGGVVFTTIQKFAPADGETLYPKLSDRENIIVLADEAHRSQYGFNAKQVDLKDETGNIIGKQTKYGFARYIRDALPNATFIGFTGTPIENSDKNTPEVFGSYIDIYDIAKAVDDGATVPIYYESRLAKLELSQEGRDLLDELDDDLEYEDLSATQQAKAKSTRLEAIVGSTERLKAIAKDIVEHFSARQTANRGKAMIVTMSRRIAANLYDELIAALPDGWHSDELNRGKIKVVMTANASDEGNLVRHHTSKRDRQILAQRLKDPDDPLELVIVCDMWLTGFDAPCLHTMYIDKPLKAHNLMQAIARINRVYLDKEGGLVVDYLGLAGELKKALNFYANSGGKGDLILDRDKALGLLLEKLEIVRQILGAINPDDYLNATTGDKLALLKRATDYACDPTRKDRFLHEVVALSKAYALAVPAPEAIAQAETISFYQAIQASIRKLEPSDGSLSDRELESAVRQVVDQALVTDTVVNILDDAGIKNPDLSILDENFIADIRGMEHKNLAVECLKKLLNDEIRSRRQTNIVQSRTLADMLDDALRRYHNQAIEVADVIEELIAMSQEIQAADRRGEELGLAPYELAFYDALAQNDSAVAVMGIEGLRELALVLTERIKKNASIDWNLKESVRARMKVMVKRLLKKYGYPPDMAALAIELVLEQAKLLTESEVNPL
jgi:type I restriction enzyme R subunit